MHLFKDMFAGFRDFFGGRSKAVQDTLRDARRNALTELRREALIVGADAVIAVDLFGLPANYTRLNKIAKEYKVSIIADAAQSFGGSLKNIKVGAINDISCTS